jgi:flagellar basal-body rod protein FlgC
MDSALSGIRAFETKLDVSANNIANAQSDGFKKDRVQLTATATGGVSANVEKIDTPGPLVGEDTPEGYLTVEKSNVELAEEIVNMQTAVYGVKANMMTLRAQDEMMGTLLDMKR